MEQLFPGSRLGSGFLFALHRQSHALDARMQLHDHAEGQIFLVSEGLLVVTTKDGSWMMPPGQIGWIPPGMPHGASVHGAMTGWTGYVHRDLCAPLPRVPAVYRMSDLARAVLGRLQECATVADTSGRNGRLVTVLLDEIASLPRQPMHLPMPSDGRLAGLATALAADPSRSQSLDELARTAGLSRRSLTRRFRTETGMSLVAWRQVARMQRALELLAAGTTVTATAHELGYDSASQFTALFRRMFGATPRQFLRKPDP